MRKTLAAAALAIAFLAVPGIAAADSCCDPASDTMVTQDPLTYSGFVSRPCATPRSVNCYWDAIGRQGGGEHSFWSIRVGRQVCVKYWDAEYNRTHGRCHSLRGHR